MLITNIAVAIKAAIKNNVEVTVLLQEVDRVQEMLNTDNTPRLLRAFDEGYAGKYLSRDVEQLMDFIVGSSSRIGNGEVFAKLAEACDICARELKSMRSLVNKDNIEFILKENLEVKQGYIIHYLASAEFMNRYMRTMMIVVTELESAAYRKAEPERGSNRYFKELMEGDRLRSFVAFVDFLLIHAKDSVIDDIYKMPPLDIDEATINAVKSTGGDKAIDPVGLQATTAIGNLLNLVNPIAWAYAGQKIWSEMLLWLLEEDEKEIRYLESRYQELIEIQETGNPTVSTTKSVERYGEEIVRIRARIKRIREKLNDGRK
jgi:hypothetical protein